MSHLYGAEACERMDDVVVTERKATRRTSVSGPPQWPVLRRKTSFEPGRSAAGLESIDCSQWAGRARGRAANERGTLEPSQEANDEKHEKKPCPCSLYLRASSLSRPQYHHAFSWPAMLGFDYTPSSVNIDFSFFGGAEEVPPWLRPLAYKKGQQRPRSDVSSASMSASSSVASSSSQRSSSPSSRSASPDMTDADSVVAAPILEKSDSSASTSGAGAPWLPQLLPVKQDQQDFLWLLTEEPHRTRRQAILKAHPEIKSLMGREPLTKWIAMGVVATQLAAATAMWYWQIHPFDWRFLLTAYVVGGTANQNIFLAIHEITHNLAFKGIRANKALAIAVNTVIGVPYAMMFKVRPSPENRRDYSDDELTCFSPTVAPSNTTSSTTSTSARTG